MDDNSTVHGFFKRSVKSAKHVKSTKSHPCVLLLVSQQYLLSRYCCNGFEILLLHLIDHATHLSAYTRVASKHPESIIKGIFTHWISVYGPVKQFLTDNGGELVNEVFVTLCESFNITVQTTGAEAPWFNDLV